MSAAYKAAKLLLTAPVFDERLLPAVRESSIAGPDSGYIEWDYVRELALQNVISDGEAMLVEAAYQLHTNRTDALLVPDARPPTLMEIASALDGEHRERFLLAVQTRLKGMLR